MASVSHAFFLTEIFIEITVDAHAVVRNNTEESPLLAMPSLPQG